MAPNTRLRHCSFHQFRFKLCCVCITLQMTFLLCSIIAIAKLLLHPSLQEPYNGLFILYNTPSEHIWQFLQPNIYQVRNNSRSFSNSFFLSTEHKITSTKSISNLPHHHSHPLHLTVTSTLSNTQILNTRGI